MSNLHPPRCTAFEGFKCIASGELPDVALKTKAIVDKDERAGVLIFDDATSDLVEVDFRGAPEDVLKRLAERGRQSPVAASGSPATAGSRGPGRPKLGVVGREVTLLPRHWDWLSAQPGGASVALRKLVDEARRTNDGRDRVRRAQEAAYRFMSAIAGNLPGFEEAIRALFAAKREPFDETISGWPADVRDHTKKLAAAAF